MTTPQTEAGRALLTTDARTVGYATAEDIIAIEREAVAAALDEVEQRLAETDDARLADSVGSTRSWGMVRRVDVEAIIREVREP